MLIGKHLYIKCCCMTSRTHGYGNFVHFFHFSKTQFDLKLFYRKLGWKFWAIFHKKLTKLQVEFQNTRNVDWSFRNVEMEAKNVWHVWDEVSARRSFEIRTEYLKFLGFWTIVKIIVCNLLKIRKKIIK